MKILLKVFVKSPGKGQILKKLVSNIRSYPLCDVLTDPTLREKISPTM